MKQNLAKTIRVLTVPPVLAFAMLLILWHTFGDDFAEPPALAGAVLLLAVVPACAYPAAAAGKGGADNTRSRQRRLAFAFNLFGYAGALILGILTHCGHMLLTVMNAYFIAVLYLTLLNKAFHIKASGHACSCALPYLFLIYWLGIKAVIPCVLLYGAEFWASVSLKRHTPREFLLGSAVAAVTFVHAWGTMLHN